VTLPTKAAFDLGRACWPTIRGLTFDAFLTFVEHAAMEPDALSERAGDIYLAAAAAGGDADAVKLFDGELLAELPRWLSRLQLTADQVDEVGQLLRAKLLVGPPPKLTQYRAGGPLGAWVRVAAVRTALDLCGSASMGGDAGPDRGDPLLVALDPEQQLVRNKYGPLFETALRDAMKQLSTRDRNLLRFHYVSGMSLDAIARIYHVHRATAARWLAAIRDELEADVSARLWQDLGVSPAELRSLWNAVRSEVDVSLSRLLAVG
jgi:RNA polymerase sigma-70 factor (ECF subfamily)